MSQHLPATPLAAALEASREAPLEVSLAPPTPGEAEAEAVRPSAAVIEIDVDRLVPGRYQPRRRLTEEKLAELAETIRDRGVLQPLVVRRLGEAAPSESPAGHQADHLARHLSASPAKEDRNERFEIVAGERRWRAAQQAGLTTVPVIVRELDDRSALAVALIENLQREDLNPIDQAESLARLADEFGLTHEQIAQSVGRSRAAVTNTLRLLDLCGEARELLSQGAIDMGHARALLPLPPAEQAELARKAHRRGLSVRQVEKAVRTLMEPAPARPQTDLETRWLAEQLARELGQRVSIRRERDGRYTLAVGFGELGELRHSLERIETLIGQVLATTGFRARTHSREETG